MIGDGKFIKLSECGLIFVVIVYSGRFSTTTYSDVALEDMKNHLS